MDYDCLIIGAGISGASAACELAAGGKVVLVEAETSPGYHSTGRSAALFTPNYGGPLVRRINRASRSFFQTPPAGFADHPLLTPRGGLTIAAPGEVQKLAATFELSSADNEIMALTASEALALAPLLCRERVAAAAYEPGVMDIDTSALHQGYLRSFKQRGGHLTCGQRVTALRRGQKGWEVSFGASVITARIVVNAAGAWAGQVGALAGAMDIGLVAKRRTAIIVDGPPGMMTAGMPTVDFAGTPAYLKPESGRIMVSPGDEAPIEAQDAQPDELDVAVLVDWLERETVIKVRRIAHSWAGLRSFVADEAPVAGFDPQVDDFFWLAGQGGYGIMMAPALGRATASLIRTGALPEDLRSQGIAEVLLAPDRLRVTPDTQSSVSILAPRQLR